MENTNISLDLYPLVISRANWATLQQLKKVNRFIYQLTIKEIGKRLKSNYPFGEQDAKVLIIIRDIELESITCFLDKQEILIPRERYPAPWIRNMIISWFAYSYRKQNYILTSKLFKAMIRIINKRIAENRIFSIDEDQMKMTFRFKDGISILEEIS